MTLRWMYDAAYPPPHPPHWHVAAGYIGGDTPHVWTPEEWAAQWAPYRLPIYTASNREDTEAAAVIDAGIIHRALTDLAVPEGVTIAVDIETRVYTVYLETLNRAVTPYHLLTYGSFSTLIQNPQTSAGRWAADWTDDIFKGVDLLNEDRLTAVQWASDVQRGLPYDSSIIIGTLPLWHK